MESTPEHRMFVFMERSMEEKEKEYVCRTLENADIRIDGDRDWDLRVHDERLYRRVLRQGSLGLGEAYMDEWWDCRMLDAMFCRLLRARLDSKAGYSWPVLLNRLQYRLLNPQSIRHSGKVAEVHYDFGNDLFSHVLGPTMNYSCARWTPGAGLDEAQLEKMENICRKLQLRPGMKVLDIGCGWGALARHMAAEYQVDVTAVTISGNQYAYAREQGGARPIRWLLDDYRHLDGLYDRVVSVGMFEHVGIKNYDGYMLAVRRMLRPDGVFLLHTIGSNRQLSGVDPWIAKYIFPNGMLPSLVSVGKSVEGIFVMEDWENIGVHYDATLTEWHRRFEDGYARGVFACSRRQYRMFRYYLLCCAGAFRARDLQVWQIVFSPQGMPDGYDRAARA
jgi:cyclopropane-fatty-acyl-phospholipid synthase